MSPAFDDIQLFQPAPRGGDMKFTLTNLSFDFGQRRANASLNASEPGYASMIISVPFQPPANVSADALEDHLLDEIRKTINDAVDFSHVKKG